MILVVFEGIADIFSKKYSLDGSTLHWVLAISGYVIANIFWLSAIRGGSGLARGAVLFSIGSAAVAVLLGLFLYKEDIGKTEMVGIFVGLVSIVLLVWPDLKQLLS